MSVRLLTYLRAPSLRLSWIQLYPLYWHLRRRVSVGLFKARRRTFLVKTGVSSLGRNGSILWQLVLHIIPQLALAAMFVAGIWFLEHLFPVTATIPSLTIRAEAEYGFLATLSQVSAALLGLYFTAVSVVAGSAYARGPEEVRATLLAEQVGTVYFSLLAHFAATAVLMMSAVTLGITLGALSITWISFLALLAILSFVALGLRTFAFFKPTAVIEHLNRRLTRAMNHATPSGFKWQDESFQNHQRLEAERVLDVYAALGTIAKRDDDLHGHSLVEIGEGLLRALGSYAVLKGRIPSDSMWFRRRHVHRKWITTGDSEVGIALATGTALPPEKSPDVLWIEDDVTRILERLVRQFAERDDFEGLLRLLDLVQRYSSAASNFGGVEESLMTLRRLGHEIDLALQQKNLSGSTEPRAKLMSYLACEDVHALALINVLLGFSRYIDELAVSRLEERVSAIRWHRVGSLYHSPLPRTATRIVENARARLEFEVQIEGALVTPLWLRVEVVARGACEFIAKSINEIISEFELRFGDAAEKHMKSNDPIRSASLISRGLEAVNKLGAHQGRFRAQWDALSELNHSRDWEWPSIDWDAVANRRRALESKLIGIVARCMPRLTKFGEKDDMPDLFGQGYAVLADACFNSLIREDEKMFSEIFPSFFSAALASHDIAHRAAGKVNNSNLRVVMGPLTDLLAISGFAELYAALLGKSFAKDCRRNWDAYFAAQSEPTKNRAILEMLAISKEHTLGYSSRDMLRYRWKQAGNEDLMRRGIRVDRYGFDRRFESAPRHSNPLVRAVAGRGNILNDAEDIFFATYLYTRPEAVGMVVPDDVKSLQRSLAREDQPSDEDADE